MFEASRARSQRSRSSRSSASIIDWSSARCWGVIERSSDCIAAIRWVSCSTMSSSVRAPGKKPPCFERKSSTSSWPGSRPSSRSSSSEFRSRTISRFAWRSSGVVPWIAWDRPSTKRSSVWRRSRSVSAWNRSRAAGSMKSYSSSDRIRLPTSRGSDSSWSSRRAAASRSIFRSAASDASDVVRLVGGGLAASSSRRSIPARSSATISSSSAPDVGEDVARRCSAPGARRARAAAAPAARRGREGPAGSRRGRASRAPSGAAAPRRGRPRP